ncbi:MAG: ABC transporter ATP-binding protein [Eubacteriales bacterium]|nr:ABC transporter ATP-binding protein [Eubacteriales bacterium]
MKTNTLVECRGLTKTFPGALALDRVDLTLGRGKIIGLLGPNGSGKTTLIKIMNGLIRPTAGTVTIDGENPGPYTKSQVSYLPDKNYFADCMKVYDLLNIFEDFYEDFDRAKATEMCASLGIRETARLKEMSKGTKEKMQLIMVMSRKAQLYLLDEPIAGVDPAARDYILNTIISNYNEEGTILISTHLISDIEKVLDEVVFLKEGRVIRHEAVEDIRIKEGKSIDEVFRDDFRMVSQRTSQELGDWHYVNSDAGEVRDAGNAGEDNNGTAERGEQ